MILIWSGLGFLVLPILVVGGLLFQSIADHDPRTRWPRMIAVLGTALALAGLGLLLNRPRVVGHDQFGNAVTHSGNHSLYWIPVQYWGAIVLIFGTYFVFK
jgi:ribose/xylose/arabinose/galactoside ABC-type transport system permease subunit